MDRNEVNQPDFMSICLYVCLSTRMCHNVHVSKFLQLSPVAVSQPSSDIGALCFVANVSFSHNGAGEPESSTVVFC